MVKFHATLALTVVLGLAAVAVGSPRGRSGRPLDYNSFPTDPSSNSLVNPVQGRSSGPSSEPVPAARNSVGITKLVSTEPIDRNLVNEELPEDFICMKKIMETQEYVYQDVEMCTHSTMQQCMNTWVTVMTVTHQPECNHGYEKVCHTTFELVPRTMKQTTCRPHYERVCGSDFDDNAVEGPEEQTCTTQGDVICTTKHMEYTIDEDETDCQEVQDETICDGIDGHNICTTPPSRQECTIRTVQRTKTMPNVECESTTFEVCGRITCPLQKLSDICEDNVMETTFRRPLESCSLQARQECQMVPVHSPTLKEQKSCSEIPFDSCKWEKGNPKLETVESVKIWCGPPQGPEAPARESCLNHIKFSEFDEPSESFQPIVRDLPSYETGKECADECENRRDVCDAFSWDSDSKECSMVSFVGDGALQNTNDVEKFEISFGSLSGQAGCEILDSDDLSGLTFGPFTVTASSQKASDNENDYAPKNTIDGITSIIDTTNFVDAWVAATKDTDEWIVMDLQRPYSIASIGITAPNVLLLGGLEIRIGNTKPTDADGVPGEREENEFCHRVTGFGSVSSSISNFYQYNCQNSLDDDTKKVILGRYISLQRKVAEIPYDWPIFEMEVFSADGNKIEQTEK